MHVNELFQDAWTTGDEDSLRTELLQNAIRGPMEQYSDIELASALVGLLHQDLEAFGTGGGNRIPSSNSDEFRLLVQACKRVNQRLGLEFPDLPFRDMPGFRDYWIREAMDWSYAKRRNYLNSAFNEIEFALDDLQYKAWEDTLFVPITPHSSTGWGAVDSEIVQLRQRFSSARTEQDHSAIGNSCVRILELLGDVAFDPDKYLAPGEDTPARDKTKIRFDKIIYCELTGSDNEELRGYARKLVELAHMVKHRATPSRKDAGGRCRRSDRISKHNSTNYHAMRATNHQLTSAHSPLPSLCQHVPKPVNSVVLAAFHNHGKAARFRRGPGILKGPGSPGKSEKVATGQGISFGHLHLRHGARRLTPGGATDVASARPPGGRHPTLGCASGGKVRPYGLGEPSAALTSSMGRSG